MDEQVLEKIIIEQNEKINININSDTITRELLQKMNFDEQIIVITGIRRCGKSTLLNQFLKKENTEFGYLNFDDDRLFDFKIEDFERTKQILLKKNKHVTTFAFDEIQNIKGFELFLNRLQREKFNVIITGSNANLLSGELATHLTGRHIDYKLFPFSFKEYLELKKNETKEIIEKFDDYLIKGGFPKYLQSENKQHLQTILIDLIEKDVLLRLNIKDKKICKGLVYFLISNIGKPITYSSLAKNTETKSPKTIKSYLDALCTAFLFFEVQKYSSSIKKQIHSPKKIYCIDNGLSVENGFRISNDLGRLFENLVFIELKRKNNEIFYHYENKECDFLIREQNKITKAIQVCYEITKENKTREIEGLLEALRKYNLSEGLLITRNNKEIVRTNTKKVRIIPITEFLMNE